MRAVEAAQGGAHAVEAEEACLVPCFGQPVGVEQHSRAGRRPPRTLEHPGSAPTPSGGPWPARSALGRLEPQRRWVAGVGPAQELLVRVIGDAGGGDELVVMPARSISAVFAQLSRRPGSSENGAVAANVVRMNAARRAACKPCPTTSPTTRTVESWGPSATR